MAMLACKLVTLTIRYKIGLYMAPCSQKKTGSARMFGFDAIELARMQFAFTVSAHIIFPVFSIGLASFLAVLNGAHFITQNEICLKVFN